jgi:hypothetical protein
MSAIVLYVIESSVLLALLYFIYAIGLRGETFFQFNRWVLLAIPLISLLLPMIRWDLSDVQPIVIEQSLKPITRLSGSYYDVMASWESEIKGSSNETVYHPFSWQYALINLIVLIYVSGVILCLSRTAWSIRWIKNMITKHSVIENDGMKIVKLSHPTAPFSFLNFVFVHAPVADSDDFRQILDHERIHAKEKHTFDLLYIKLVAALLWFNPVVWQLLKSIKKTHEYIADRKIIQSGYSVAAYQTLLLRQLISNNSYELGHNFNLSFIKKRITMMTNKQSGWAGRVKAGIAILSVLCVSSLIIQCNSKLDEQVSPELISSHSLSGGVTVPVLPMSHYKFQGDLTDALTFSIHSNTLWIGDMKASLEDIAEIQGEEYGRKSPIIMMVDKNQQMGFVREVEFALREANRRKLLYIGQTESGDRTEVIIMLPPHPKTALDGELSQVPEEHLLTIHLGKNEGVANQKKVYDFVMDHLANGKAEFAVVSAKVDDDVSHGVYLSNLFYIKEGYIQLYQERAQKMFGKDFYQTNEEEYKAVREKLPTNISIAEK